MAPIFGFMDFIAVSYYLINPADNFTVRSPNGISVELFKLVYNPVFLGIIAKELIFISHVQVGCLGSPNAAIRPLLCFPVWKRSASSLKLCTNSRSTKSMRSRSFDLVSWYEIDTEISLYLGFTA